MKVESIDLYINYSCNYRCKHCFIGDDLNNKDTLSENDISKIVEYCVGNFKTNEVVLLGGEPTIHKQINKIIYCIYGKNISKIRLVTNGSLSCENFIKNFSGNLKPKLVFSVDGSKSEIHDAIRGKGAFEQLVKTIKAAKKNGYEIDAITSISSMNLKDTFNILDFLDLFEFGTVNFHYVSARGYANSNIQLFPAEWLSLRQKIINYSKKLKILIRYDTIFLDKGFSEKNSCKIREKSNLMFFPNGNVYSCGLFVGSSYKSAFRWSDGKLVEQHENSEISCAENTDNVCPGIKLAFKDAENGNALESYNFSCMYNKDKLNFL